MELLAPVNADTLQAALDAGADAVYFGLTRLNARRGARNFAPDELAGVVQRIHAAGAKAHLTLNIDLATREIGLAARTLQLASEAGVDAVIVRDAAILSLIPHFPQLEFHLSTQAGVSSAAGVRAAKALGCHRVVLARELTATEIRAAAAIEGIEIEVFAQGAMCFSCSGRCLLSSWVGGRSGTRGTCASPCRVAWQATGAAEKTHPMSMHDLCLLERLGELREMGVASLKIEGRLKSASWVSRAVSLYRKALDGTEKSDALRTAADALGDYTGRELSEAYYASQFAGLTDEAAGRKATTTAQPCAVQENNIKIIDNKILIIIVNSDAQKGTNFTFNFGELTQSLRIPWQRVPNPRRALALGDILKELCDQQLAQQEHTLDCPEELAKLLLPRRCQAQVADALAEFLRRTAKPDDGAVRLELPPEILRHLALPPRNSSANCHRLDEQPDRLRVDHAALQQLLRSGVEFPTNLPTLVLEVTPGEKTVDISRLPATWRENFLYAMPQVAYEEDLAQLREVLAEAKSLSRCVEVNSWDTLQLAKEAGVRFEAGPGLAVLNPLAAQFLQELGAEACAVSPEIDEEKFTELCQHCAAPLTATVFARPALMTTRAILPEGFAPPTVERFGPRFEDARGTALYAERAGALTVLRPETPYDWRRLGNHAKLRVAHLTLDLCGSRDPAHDLAAGPADTPFLFNFDRTLK